MEANYYFDLIAINTIFSKAALVSIFNGSRLEDHCDTLGFCEASSFAKIHGYEGKILLYQPTDNDIEELKSSGIGNYSHSISRIEIAKDRIFNNSLSARRYLKAFQNCCNLKWGKDIFSINDSKYIGKEYGSARGFYVNIYDPEERKFGLENNVHTEFRLIGWPVIRRKLGVNSISDLRSPEEYFEMLEKKYLVRATINTNRCQRYFPDENPQSIGELIATVKAEKNRIKVRLANKLLIGYFGGSRVCQKLGVEKVYTLSARDKLLTKQGVKYFLKEL